MCIVTGRREPAEAMIRFVCGPDGKVTPDIRARLPGRGVWVSARSELVAEAAKRRAFSRGLKEAAEAPPALAEDVDQLLEADCLQMLALANKAGAVAAGFGKVSDALQKGGVAAVIEARDGGEDGKRKLRQAARVAGCGSRPPAIGLFTSNQLDLALGRTNVIHAALTAGGPADGFLARCRRLAAYRGLGLDGAQAPGAPSNHMSNFTGPEAAKDRNLDE
jgi:hypothetical protein